MGREENSIYKIAHERVDAYLMEHGARASVVRDMILSQVCQLKQPFTADQLREVCETERVAKATVYNALNVFIAAGVLHEYDRKIGQTVTEYELITNARPHMQIVCTKCGKKTNFNDKAIIRLVNERKYLNFTPHRFTLVVYGECKTCRKRNRITQHK